MINCDLRQAEHFLWDFGVLKEKDKLDVLPSPWKNAVVKRGLLGIIRFLWEFEAFIEDYPSFKFGLLKPNHLMETLRESAG